PDGDQCEKPGLLCPQGDATGDQQRQHQGGDGDLVGGNATCMEMPHQWAQQILKAWLELVDGEHSSIPFDVGPGLTVTSQDRVGGYQPDPDFGVNAGCAASLLDRKSAAEGERD